MDPDDHVAARLARLPALLEGMPALQQRGRFLSTECLVGLPGRAFRLRIAQGRIVQMDPRRGARSGNPCQRRAGTTFWR